MYIFKNAWKSIIRNKGRNILITIIIMVIASSTAISLATLKSASDIVDAYNSKNPIEASISMNREVLISSLREGDKTQEEMINSFNDIKGLSEDEIKNYADSDYIKEYYYTYSLGVDAKNLTEATDSLVKETTEVKTETSTSSWGSPFNGGKMPPRGGNMGGKTTSKKTTTTTTEKIFNEKADNGAFTLIGYNSYEDMKKFVNGEYIITEGNVSDDFNSSNCVISEELATLNKLKVNDKITVIDTNNTKNTYELTITGIYKENTDSSNDITSMFSNSANEIITNTNFIKKMLDKNSKLTENITPTFILKDKEGIESFSKEVEDKGLSEYYMVTSNIEEIESATKSINNVKTFSTAFLIITLLIGGIVLSVINMINIRERKYEIGVLRTIGMKKSKLSLQFMFELLIVSLLGLSIGACIGSFTSVKVANKLLESEIKNTNEEYNNISKNFGIPNEEEKGEEVKQVNNRNRYNFGVANINEVNNINAVVDIKVLLELLGIGVILTLISSLASMISISRFSPLTILKERS